MRQMDHTYYTIYIYCIRYYATRYTVSTTSTYIS
jgi:hypothetical protein